jgi:hypothetical protein
LRISVPDLGFTVLCLLVGAFGAPRNMRAKDETGRAVQESSGVHNSVFEISRCGRKCIVAYSAGVCLGAEQIEGIRPKKASDPNQFQKGNMNKVVTAACAIGVLTGGISVASADEKDYLEARYTNAEVATTARHANVQRNPDAPHNGMVIVQSIWRLSRQFGELSVRPIFGGVNGAQLCMEWWETAARLPRLNPVVFVKEEKSFLCWTEEAMAMKKEKRVRTPEKKITLRDLKVKRDPKGGDIVITKPVDTSTPKLFLP